MNEMRRITKKYYLRQIVAYWLVFYMLFCFGIPLRAVMADQNPAAGTLPSDLINSTGVNAPIVDDILHTMDITQTADQAIMNWTNFDIGSGAKVEFFQPTTTSAVLNRIHDGSPTGIMGTLQANGRVFIINPAGVLFGEGAAVNVAQLVASHLNIADGDFLTDDFEFNIDNMEEFLDINPDYLATVTGDGAIINHGTIGNIIKTEGVILLGKRILNTGTIKTKSGGFVAMAAGDRVLLGEPGSKIIVEMTSVQNPQGDEGHVINSETGEISAPEGQIVLAAGDIFSLGAGLETEPVKVFFGNGWVEQSGTISANGTTGDGGTVTLTSADETVLALGSSTTANAGTGGDSGLVTVHSADTTIVEKGAQIQATGGYTPVEVEDSIAPLFLITENSVEIIGDTINLAGDIDTSATDITKKGKILIEADNLTIANGSMPDDPPDNTLYEKWIEAQSGTGDRAGTDLELVAHSKDEAMIVVEEIGDGEITGGRGDIYLRTKYDSGGISFVGPDPEEPSHAPATLKTDDGGNIFMVAGSGGITTGDIETVYTRTPGEKNRKNAGRIRLLTSNNGAIQTGSMITEGAIVSEISAIASSDLTIDGEAFAYAHTTDDPTKPIGFARICLVSVNGYVTVDGSSLGTNKASIEVHAHGKEESNADILICAGKNVDLINFETTDSVKAFAQVSTADAGNYARSNVTIVAGGLEEPPDPANPTVNQAATITINGETDIKALSIKAETKVSGAPGGAGMSVTPLDDEPEVPDDDENTVIAKDDDAFRLVEIKIHKDFAERQPEDPCPGCPCEDCPKPPDFPSEVFAVDDFAEAHMDTILLEGENWLLPDPPLGYHSSVLDNDLGATDVLFWSPTEFGALTINLDTGEFEYIPLPGYVGTVTSTYLATDGETTDTAILTITLTNTLPEGTVVLNDAHMDASGEIVTVASGDFTDGETDAFSIVSIDPATDDENYGYGGTLTYNGTSDPYSSGDDYTYSADGALPGYVGEDNFDVQLWDGQNDYQQASTSPGSGWTLKSGTTDIWVKPVYGDGAIELTLGNTPPGGTVVLNDAHMDASGEIVTVASGDFTDGETDAFSIVSIDPATDDENYGYGGTLTYNGTSDPYSSGDDYTYSADGALPGYVGEDNFDVQLWDGQNTYTFLPNGSVDTVTPVYGDGAIELTLGNTPPGGTVVLNDAHMDASGEIVTVASGDFTDGETDAFSIESIDPATDDENYGYGGTLTYNGTSDPYSSGDDYTYSADGALPGYVGEDDFDVQLWDGQNTYTFLPNGSVDTVTPVYGAGTIDLTVTNTLPTAGGDLGTTPQNTTLIVDQDPPPPTGTSFPVFVNDDDAPLDDLSIIKAMIPDHYTGSAGGKLEFNGSEWIYTPAPGHTGAEEFTVKVWDGQYDYTFYGEGEIFDRTEVYGQGMVNVTVKELPPPPVLLPAIPVPVIRAPEVEGCPAVIAAAAGEIGIPKQTVQIWIGRSLASGVDIQPCDVCSRLVSTAAILRDETGARLAALAEVINTIAPADVPFTPELGAQIATAFEQRLDEDVRYATAQEYIDALVAYVLILQEELPGIVADPIVFTMDKYGGGIMEQDNANIGAFVGMRLEAVGGL